MLVSAKHQHESAIGIHMSPPSWTSLLPPFPGSWISSAETSIESKRRRRWFGLLPFENNGFPTYLRVLCCWLLIAHIRRGSNGLAPSQQYFMSFGGWQLLKHLGWRQEGTCFRRTDLRCSFIHLFSVFWRSRENSRGRLSFPGGWNQQSFGIWVGRGWEVSL